MEQINIGDIAIDIVRKDIKNIHLAVYPPTGRVRIAVPHTTDDDAIRLFAASKIGWIKRSQRKFEEQERITLREYKNRESHYFQGRRYLLDIIEENSAPRVTITKKKYINLFVRLDTPTEKRHEVMVAWYRKELKKQVPEFIAKWEKIMNVQVNEWQIKKMKTKWGACNIEKKRIWLNLELAKKPDYCLEYIIVHEMIHLLERHHNDKFLYHMSSFLPNWKQSKSALNKLPASHADWSY